ncbi:MAG TPA: FliH/SctL family protein [Phycisphaerae bacterium]|nr:FliH/SctL family protein [Phycisphaerae bacterium]
MGAVTGGGPASPGAAAAAEARRAAEAERQLEETHQQLRADSQALRQARAALDRASGEVRQAVLAEAEQQLLDLALGIARKVLRQEIQAGRYEIDPIVAEAMEHIPARCEVTVHLHPDDYARCRAIAAGPDDSNGPRFVADANVLPGECFLETSEGTVESSVETQLSEITHALKQPG